MPSLIFKIRPGKNIDRGHHSIFGMAGKKNKVAIKNTSELSTISSPVIAEAVQNALYWTNDKKFPKVQNAKECAQRLNFFFNKCVKTGEYPTVEKMCIALGSHVREVYEWETHNTMGSEVSYMIRRAKNMIAAVDAELASNGYMNTVIYIFRSKNFYGMQDQAKVEITTKTDYRSETEQIDDIAKRYALTADFTEHKK